MQPKLYTGIIEYSATGEGITLIAVYGFFESPEACVDHLAKKHGNYYASGADVSEGFLYDHSVIKFLLSDNARDRFLIQGICGIWEGYYHENFS